MREKHGQDSTVDRDTVVVQYPPGSRQIPATLAFQIDIEGKEMDDCVLLQERTSMKFLNKDVYTIMYVTEYS